MLSLTDQEVDVITTQLLKGMVCFFQIDTRKIHYLPDDEDYFNYDLTPEEEDILDELDADPENFAEFTKMESQQEYQLMQDFIDRQVKERNLAEELVHALTKPKALTAFKFLIDKSKYQAQWLAVRQMKYQDWVREQVDSYNYTED